MKVRSFIKKGWVGILFLLIYFLNVNWKLPYTFNDKRVLFSVDTLHILYQQVKEHNENLRALLQTKISDESKQVANREASHQQMRGFYVLIVSGLIFLALSLTEKPKTEYPVLKIVLLFIIVMYGLDVHELDLNKRLRRSYEIYHKELNTLVNLPEDSVKWFVFSSREIKPEMSETSKWGRRYIRKIVRATKPDTSQLVLYGLPFAAIYWYIKKYNVKIFQSSKKFF